MTQLILLSLQLVPYNSWLPERAVTKARRPVCFFLKMLGMVAKSLSHHEMNPWSTFVRWYLQGSSFPGFLRWCRILSVHSGNRCPKLAGSLLFFFVCRDCAVGWRLRWSFG